MACLQANAPGTRAFKSRMHACTHTCLHACRNIAKLLHRLGDEGGPGGADHKDCGDSITIDGVAEDPNNLRKQVGGRGSAFTAASMLRSRGTRIMMHATNATSLTTGPARPAHVDGRQRGSLPPPSPSLAPYCVVHNSKQHAGWRGVAWVCRPMPLPHPAPGRPSWPPSRL